MPADYQSKYFRGEVNYNPEDDQHFPSLNVWQTLKFSLMNKTRKHDQAEIPIIINAFLKMFGISHTKHTLVGNEYVRGISGGERKRVSIAETLTTKSTVVCWDNSTRGLDASTALDYVKSLRVLTDVSNRTTLVTLYQAGEDIYELMDKVLVIEGGRMLYQGPANDAREYFEDLGFLCPVRWSANNSFPCFVILLTMGQGQPRIFLHLSVILTCANSSQAEKLLRQRHHRNSKPRSEPATLTKAFWKISAGMNRLSGTQIAQTPAGLRDMLINVGDLANFRLICGSLC
jgi:ABC-type multidrug transport system ATPase subunit